MQGIEAVIAAAKSQDSIFKKMLSTISQQNKSLLSADSTLKQIYTLQLSEPKDNMAKGGIGSVDLLSGVPSGMLMPPDIGNITGEFTQEAEDGGEQSGRIIEAIQASDSVMQEMLGTLTQQSTTLVSVDRTLQQIYGLQTSEAREEARIRKRDLQSLKRSAADPGDLTPQESSGKDEEEKEDKKGGLIDALLGLFSAGGLIGSLFQGALDKIFGPEGFFRAKIGEIFGKDGFLRTKVKEIFGKDGFLRTKVKEIFGKEGFLRTQLGQIFGPNGFFRKTLGDSLRNMVNGVLKKFNLPTIPDPAKPEAPKPGTPKPGKPKPGKPTPEAPKPSGNKTSPAANAPGNPRNTKPKTPDVKPDGKPKTPDVKPDGKPKTPDVKAPKDALKNPKGTPKLPSGGKQLIGKVAKAAGPIVTAGMAGLEFKDRKDAGQTNSQAAIGTGAGVAGGFAGAAAGGKAGAAAGAAIGALFGGIGAAPGAVIGGLIGSLIGGVGGSMAAGKLADDVTGVNKPEDQEVVEPLKRARGGPITIPGSSFGDSVPMALPPGSFVLNRTASQFFQEGGLVNTVLEPKEKVFLPGDPNMGRAMALNQMVPRFQSGGSVDNGMLAKQIGASYGISSFSKNSVGTNLRYLSTGDSINLSKDPSSVGIPGTKLQKGGLVIFQGHGDVPSNSGIAPGTDGPNSPLEGKYKPTAEQYFMNKIAVMADKMSKSITYQRPTGKYTSGFQDGANWSMMRKLRSSGQSAFEIHADGYDGRPGKFKGKPGVLPGTQTGPQGAVGKAEQNIRSMFGMYDGSTRAANIVELDHVMNVSKNPQKYAQMLVKAAEGTGGSPTGSSGESSGQKPDNTGTQGKVSGKFEYPLPKGKTGTGPAQIFGAPRDGGARKHAGVDLVETAPWGGDPKIPVVAPKDGVVSKEKYTTSGYTAGLILKQSDGYDTRYVHMTPEVKPGTEVKAGDTIGKLIDLKNQSHLHFELYKSGSTAAMDPTPYLSSAGKTPGAGSTLPGMQPAPDGSKGEETGVTNPKSNPKSPLAGLFGDLFAPLLALFGVNSDFSAGLKAGIESTNADTGLLGSFFPSLGSLFGAPAAAATLDAAPDYMSQGSEANIEGDSTKSTKTYEIAQSMGFSQRDWDVYRNVVGKIESGNTYNPSKDAGGGSGGAYDGRYQLGAAAKKDAASYLGEKFPGHGEPKSAARMAYRRDEDMQERFFAAFTAKNHSYLTGTPEYDSLSVREKFQVLGYAHNQGAGGARAWLKTGEVRRDGFGTAATKYSTELAKAYGSQNTVGMQTGGLVDTILEPKEKVFLPGDPNMGRAMALNEMVPRFQSGGMVRGDTTTNNLFKTLQSGGMVGEDPRKTDSKDKKSEDKTGEGRDGPETKSGSSGNSDLIKLNDKNIKKASAAPGMCVTGSLETMQKSGVKNPAATGQDQGNNPRGGAVQLIKDFGWGSIGGLGSPITLKSPYGTVGASQMSSNQYSEAVSAGKVPSGAIVFQTKFGNWNGTSPGSSGYDMAIAQQGGNAHWNGQPMPKFVYGGATKNIIALTPGGTGGDGVPNSESSGDGSNGSEGELFSNLTGVIGGGLSNFIGGTFKSLLSAIKGEGFVSDLMKGFNAGIEGSGADTNLLGMALPGLGSLFGAPAAAATIDGATGAMSQVNEDNNVAGQDISIEGVTDNQKGALNVLAKYESGAAGYNAVNQGGSNAGRTVLGFSGDITKAPFNKDARPLTDMTIAEIKKRQFDDKSMSQDQWNKSGKLHAVGRYQFIGNTLPGVAERAGIPDSAKFTPQVQDLMALQLMKERGIQPWVGPSDKATPAERAIVEAARKEAIPKISMENGNAQMSSGMQKGGLVNTILEPKETVLLPGDPNIGRAMALNEMVPRFQSGGMVGGNTSTTNNLSKTMQSGGMVGGNTSTTNNLSKTMQSGGMVGGDTTNNLFKTMQSGGMVGGDTTNNLFKTMQSGGMVGGDTTNNLFKTMQSGGMVGGDTTTNNLSKTMQSGGMVGGDTTTNNLSKTLQSGGIVGGDTTTNNLFKTMQSGGMVGGDTTTNNLSKTMQSGGMVGAKKAINISNSYVQPTMEPEKKQSGGIVGTKYMSGNMDSKQEFKKINQSAGSSNQTVIVNNMNNSSGGSQVTTATGSESTTIPSLPDKPGNDIWLSHINALRRFAIG